MLGHSHAVSGALVWLASAPLVSHVVGMPLSPGQVAAGTVACAGAALLPDLDHPDSTIAHTLGPITQVLAHGVHLLAGGHRMATHSLLFVVAAGVGTWGLLAVFGSQAAAWVMFALAALAIKGLHLSPPRSRGLVVGGVVVAVEAAGLVYLISRYASGGWSFLPVAVAVGALAHLAGDCLTPERCPLLWPAKRRYGLPLIERTGDLVETAVLAPLMGVGVIYLSYSRFLVGHAGLPAIHF